MLNQQKLRTTTHVHFVSAYKEVLIKFFWLTIFLMSLNIHVVIQVKLLNSPTLSCDLNSLVYAVPQRPPSISVRKTQNIRLELNHFLSLLI